MKNALIKEAGYIGGRWMPSPSSSSSSSSSSAVAKFAVLNPATGQAVAHLPRMGAADADHAIAEAHKAWGKWRSTLASDRAKVLRKLGELVGKHADDLAHIITLENGKPLPEAKGEVAYARSFLDLYAEEATRVNGEVMTTAFHHQRMITIKQSVGPAALITPFNFPSAMVTRKIGPALAAGCTVVIKPSEETPLSSLALCALAEEAGVPAGVINCLTVGREEVQDVGLALCRSPLLRKLSFTGSTDVGKWLLRESASTVKRVSMELGGNAPFIVFDDADLDVAVKALMATKFRNAGQACIASNRVLVQKGIYDAFAGAVAAKVGKMVLGDGLASGTSMGPLINAKLLTKVTAHVDDCVAKGARLLVGGPAPPEWNAAGATFYCPTVLAGVTADMAPFREETFGPIAPIMMFESEEEAVALANDTPYGLSGYVCSRDLGRVWRVAEALECGMVGINGGAISNAATPFGGMKESGLGREGGPWGLEEYLEVKYLGMGF